MKNQIIWKNVKNWIELPKSKKTFLKLSPNKILKTDFIIFTKVIILESSRRLNIPVPDFMDIFERENKAFYTYLDYMYNSKYTFNDGEDMVETVKSKLLVPSIMTEYVQNSIEEAKKRNAIITQELRALPWRTINEKELSKYKIITSNYHDSDNTKSELLIDEFAICNWAKNIFEDVAHRLLLFYPENYSLILEILQSNNQYFYDTLKSHFSRSFVLYENRHSDFILKLKRSLKVIDIDSICNSSIEDIVRNYTNLTPEDKEKVRELINKVDKNQDIYSNLK